MESTQLFDLMGEFKLYGVKAAFGEIMATAIRRQHEPSALSATCSTPTAEPDVQLGDPVFYCCKSISIKPRGEPSHEFQDFSIDHVVLQRPVTRVLTPRN
jgi:hypothetical protein